VLYQAQQEIMQPCSNLGYQDPGSAIFHFQNVTFLHHFEDWKVGHNVSNKKSGQLTIADRCALIFKGTQCHWLIQSKTYIHDFLLVI